MEQEEPQQKPRVIVFDIECFHMNWDASVGVIFCMCWKELGKKEVFTESIWEHPGKSIIDDGPVTRRIIKVLNSADMWVTFNGIRFDVPFIQTRALANGLPPAALRPIAHKDAYYIPRFKLKLKSNSLHSVQTFLQLKNRKTPVDLHKWLEAIGGTAGEKKKARREIITHCINDVKVLDECYLQLRPLLLSHPRLWGYGPCNKCGGYLKKKGEFKAAGKRHKTVYRCGTCRGWETRLDPIRKPKGPISEG